MDAKQRAVSDFYEAFPCGGEFDEGDERVAVLPWWEDSLALGNAAGRILEVACGTGADLARLADTAVLAVGVDGSGRPLRTADRRAAKRTNMVLARADATRLPFADDTFDGVWCIGALHHMSRWRTAIDEQARVLTPGGTLTILVYRRWALQSLVFLTAHLLRPFARRLLDSDRLVGRHAAAAAEFALLPIVHLFPERTWIAALREAGLQVAAVRRRDAWFPIDRAIAPLRHSRALEGKLGRFLVIRAVKSAGSSA